MSVENDLIKLINRYNFHIIINKTARSHASKKTVKTAMGFNYEDLI